MTWRARLSKLATPHLNQMPRGAFRRLMLDKLAKLTELSNDAIDELITQQQLAQEAIEQSRQYNQQQPYDHYQQPPPAEP